MRELSWQKVLSWRAVQHFLVDRAGASRLLEVVARLGGLHAQLMTAAELAAAARCENLPAGALERALWEDRSLVKTWAMRGTLHLLPAEDLPLVAGARSAFPIRRPPSYFTYHKLSPEDYEAVLKWIPLVLDETPITREALAGRVARAAQRESLREVLLSGWGALLKPAAFAGHICYGPSQNNRVTFVLPRAWLGDFKAAEPEAAIREMARRYLRAYGPAGPEDFGRWWGLRPAQAKKVFRGLGEEVEAVQVDGRDLWALAVSLPQIKEQEPASTVRLLPQFDPLTVGVSRQDERFATAEQRPQIYRPQGWISAVLLVDGRAAGTWQMENESGKTTVVVTPFHERHERLEESILAEAQRLGAFLGTEFIVSYAD